MAPVKTIGPVTAEVAPGRPAEGDKLGVSPTYRNIAAVDELPSTFNGNATLYECFNSSVEQYGERKCLGWRPIGADGAAGPYEFLNYTQVKSQAETIASALAQSGVTKAGKLGILSANRVEWMVTIRAADVIAATIVPIYDTLGKDAVEYIINHSGLTLAIVETGKLGAIAAVAPAVSKQVRTLVYLGAGNTAELDTIRAAGISVSSWDEFMELGKKKAVEPTPPAPEDIACIMYTSGTTGRPKGVMISQTNLVVAAAGAYNVVKQARLGLGPDDSFVSSLPLAHSFQRMMEEALLGLGGHIGYWQVLILIPFSLSLLPLSIPSGTTGTPKGVMITQRAIVAGVAGAAAMVEQSGIGLGYEDSMISYMPLAHIFDRIIEEFALAVGASVGFWQGDVKKLMDDVVAFKPTLFIAVPRILERVCDAVEAKLAKGPTAARLAFRAAFAYKLFLLHQGISHWASGLGVDQVIFKKIRLALGGRVRFIVSGGAPLAAHVEDFCNVCMAPVLQGYGLTETCAASFIMLPDPRLAHTVGPPCSPTEFRLESVPELKYDATASPPKGEVVIRGPMVFAGYYKDPEKTAAEFDADGFFHTGDIGMITPEGCLKIIDRKKNIFKLAQGEYIAVEFLESKYSRSEIVEQIWVYGNSLESALVAVVVPKASWLSGFSGTDDAAAKEAMIAELARTGKEAGLKGYEMIKSVHLESEQFSVEEDLMTPSMKLKRPQLQEKYQPKIDAMYTALKKK